jgi:hypothetical protein
MPPGVVRLHPGGPERFESGWMLSAGGVDRDLLVSYLELVNPDATPAALYSSPGSILWPGHLFI